MNVAKQLFELQEIDTQIEAKEKAVKSMTAELGENDLVINARTTLAAEQKQLDDLSHEQHSLEWEIDDLTSKLKSAERDLFSGRIRIPKELSSLQQEIENLRSRRTQLEDKTLTIMEQTESKRTRVLKLTDELKVTEAEWRSKQDRLNQNIESEKKKLRQLVQNRQETVQGIDASAVQLYQTLRKQKGSAVVKVEQGICRGCRISLPVSELQLVRGGGLIQCSSCGRILYLP